MKKLFICMLAICMLLTCAACANSDQGAPTDPSPTDAPTAPTEPSAPGLTQPPADTPNPPVDKELTLSDNWKDFTFKLGDKVYQFPCSYQDFADNGLELWIDSFGKADLNQEIDGHTEVINAPCIVFDDNNHVPLHFMNNTSSSIALKQCPIESIDFAFLLSGTDTGMDTIEPETLTLAGGITGASTMDEIKSAWGEPTEVNTYDTGTVYIYKASIDGAEVQVSFGLYSMSVGEQTGEYLIVTFKQELPLINN